MNIIFALIPLALILLVVAIWAFFWAVRNEQFDDLDNAAVRILFDDESPVGQAPVGNAKRPNEVRGC